MGNLDHSKLLTRYPQLASCSDDISKAIALLTDVFKGGGKLLTLGNGGSSSDAEHISGELMKGFLSKRPLGVPLAQKYDAFLPGLSQKLQMGLPCISLGVAHSFSSAFANDVDPHFSFAQQVFVLGQKGDAIFALSTSGNSKNVVNALHVAKAKELPSIALTGEGPSLCSELATVTIRVPGTITHEVQELHLPVYHAICLELEKIFFN